MSNDGPDTSGLPRLLAIMRRLRDPEPRLPVGFGADVRLDRSAYDRGSIRGRGLHRARRAPRAAGRARRSAVSGRFLYADRSGIGAISGFEDVTAAITDKLVRRHPHVFGDGDVADADEQSRRWEAGKAAERRESRPARRRARRRSAGAACVDAGAEAATARIRRRFRLARTSPVSGPRSTRSWRSSTRRRPPAIATPFWRRWATSCSRA